MPSPPTLTIPGIALVFKRSAAQEATLQELLSAQQSPSSPLYHQWLTPETFAARFGIADEDIAATQTWLTSRGFHIDSVSRSRDRITFSGTASQIQAAFGTELHHYRTADNETHFAPAADITLPTELAPVTAAVLHLSDFRPKPNVKVQTRPQPDYTDYTTGSHYLIPSDVATMYDLWPLYPTSDGSGQGLAVVGQSYVDSFGLFKNSHLSAYASGQILLVQCSFLVLGFRRSHWATRENRRSTSNTPLVSPTNPISFLSTSVLTKTTMSSMPWHSPSIRKSLL